MQGPTTRCSLIVRLRDPRDADAWEQFVRLYAPLVYRHARRAGLQDADAADLTQEVLRGISQSVRGLSYDPRRGSFRGWLFTVVRRKLADLRARLRRPDRAAGGEAEVALDLRPASDSQDWERDYRREVFVWAAAQVRRRCSPATWQAFWRTTVEAEAPHDVAATLGMSVAAVYLARSRVLLRLKEQVRLWQDEPPS